MVNKYLENLKSRKNIHIVGAAGIEGAAVACFLADQKVKNVTLHDFSGKSEFESNFKNSRDYLSPKKSQEAYKQLLNAGYKIYFKPNYLKDIESADLIFVSQGWHRYEANQKLKELKGKIPFSSLTELYFQLAPCPIIGITGTVGKSTTTRLIYEMLKKCGQKAYLSGNDRDNPPVLDKLLKLSKDSYLVLEVSNRQLIDLKYSPHIAVVTNIFPNHLDDHGSFKNYINAKSNIVRHQKKEDFAVLNTQNKICRNFAKMTKAKVLYYSVGEKLDKLKLVGRHNLSNIAAANTVGEILNLRQACRQKTFINFKPLKHRLQKIAEIKGVIYIEDSQSTNPNSTISAIEALKDKKIVLIAGGYRPKFKISEFKRLVGKFGDPQVKKVFLIGKIAPILLQEFIKQNKADKSKIKICADLTEAVKRAAELAQKEEVVLLSPGVESFGEFKDYRERGEKFEQIVNEL